MRVEVFSYLPDCAREIRRAVFIDEQGFKEEFDDVDLSAVHLVAFDGDAPVATCRIFTDGGGFVLGRLAVIKEYRGRHMGLYLLSEAERYIKAQGGKSVALHAQVRASEFYKKAGFEEFGEMDFDEGCPHIHMKKYL